MHQSLPAVLWIVFNLMPFQEFQELILKRLFAMTLHLIVDVSNDRSLL